MKIRVFTAVAGLAVALAGPAAAQVQGDPAVLATDPGSEGAGQAPQDWGSTTLSVHTLNSFAFEAYDPGSLYSEDGVNGRYVIGGNPCFEAPLVVPTGAVIDHTELEACDTHATVNVTSILFICNMGTCSTAYSVGTTGSGGCAKVSSASGTTVVQNGASTYTMQVCTGAPGATLVFRSVRVFYRLQVSPAPATATFPNDVPTTHPFFRFVEAMAASGLTGGCAPNAFCPDQPVTRGQMAVFLSTALGLHFPN